VTASSLDKQELHRISFIAPLTTTVSGLQSGVLQEISLAEYSAFGRPVPVEVLSGTTNGSGISLENIQTVGLPANADLPGLTEIGGPNVAELSALADRNSSTMVSGTGAALTVISVPARMELGVWILDKNNQSQRIPITESISSGVQILGIEVSETSKDLERREHASGEGNHSITLPAGTVKVELPSGQVLSKDVILSDGSVYLPVAQSNKRLRAIVSPNLAKAGDVIVVNLAKDISVELEVVGNSDRFPTIPGSFAVIDQQALNNYLAQTNPELIRTSQVWLDGQVPANDLRFNNLNVVSRTQLEHDFATDPVRLEVRRMFAITALLLVFAIFGVSAIGSGITFKTANVEEWIGRGENRKQLRRAISRVTLLSIWIASLAGVAVGIIAAGNLLTAESLTWSGLFAMPPVELEVSVRAIAALILTLLGSIWAGIALGGIRRGN
jgi:hypothetical protein